MDNLVHLQTIDLSDNPLKRPPNAVAITKNIEPIGRYVRSAENMEGRLDTLKYDK